MSDINNTEKRYGTTGTGLDQLVAIIVDDARLNQKISTEEINEGAAAADA